MNDLLDLMNQISLDDKSDIKTRETYIRAPFPYAGGKGRSLEYILPRLPYRNTYIEEFGGSFAVGLARKPSPLDVYNDRYGGIVAFYRVIRDQEKLNRLLERLELTVYAREEFIWSYETWKDDDIDDVERAARWFYMVKTSFSGLGRSFGRSTYSKAIASKLRSSLVQFQDLHNRLSNVQVENQDWLQCAKDYDSVNTVHYMDPPYLAADDGNPIDNHIYKHVFVRHDHERLLDWIHNESKGFVAISGYANSLYDQYEWDDRVEWEVTASVKGLAFTETNYRSSNDDQRQKVKEVLWIKEIR